MYISNKLSQAQNGARTRKPYQSIAFVDSANLNRHATPEPSVNRMAQAWNSCTQLPPLGSSRHRMLRRNPPALTADYIFNLNSTIFYKYNAFLHNSPHRFLILANKKAYHFSLNTHFSSSQKRKLIDHFSLNTHFSFSCSSCIKHLINRRSSNQSKLFLYQYIPKTQKKKTQ